MKKNTSQKTRPKLIIDTDPGHDDALALMLLEKSGMLDILAVTTVAGNAAIDKTTDNARYVLDLIGSRTQLYSGAAEPLVRDLIQAEVHGAGGLAGADVVKKAELTGDASRRIIELVRSDPHKVSILCLGPETNLAQAFVDDPELPSLVERVVMMGGAIAVPGNKNRVGEFNIFVDPEAADIVFRADVRKTLIPLDACNDVFLTMADFEKLAGTPLYGPVRSMMAHYIRGIETYENNSAGALMYDPLAAYFLLNPGAFETRMMDVKVETASELTRGMTVADRRAWGGKSPNIEVAMRAGRDAFTADFIRILRG